VLEEGACRRERLFRVVQLQQQTLLAAPVEAVFLERG